MSGCIEISVKAEGRFIAAFAYQHMKAALLFKARVVQAEITHAGEPFGPFIEEILIHGSACFMSSAAALEALINELFMMESGPLYCSSIDFDSNTESGAGRPSTLDKYQKALDVMRVARIPKGSKHYQDACSLFHLRNALVHFKPPWDPTLNEKLEGRLRGRFSTSPFVDQGADFVALKCMSTGGVTWAVNAVFAFVEEFYVCTQSQLFPKKMEQFLSLRDTVQPQLT